MWTIIPSVPGDTGPFAAAALNLNAGRSLTDLVAFLRLVVPVGVWKMNVAACLLHHPLDVVATFSNDVGVLRVGDVHLQCYPVALVRGRREEEKGGQRRVEDRWGEGQRGEENLVNGDSR